MIKYQKLKFLKKSFNATSESGALRQSYTNTNFFLLKQRTKAPPPSIFLEKSINSDRLLALTYDKSGYAKQESNPLHLLITGRVFRINQKLLEFWYSNSLYLRGFKNNHIRTSVTDEKTVRHKMIQGLLETSDNTSKVLANSNNITIGSKAYSSDFLHIEKKPYPIQHASHFDSVLGVQQTEKKEQLRPSFFCKTKNFYLTMLRQSALRFDCETLRRRSAERSDVALAHQTNVQLYHSKSISQCSKALTSYSVISSKWQSPSERLALRRSFSFGIAFSKIKNRNQKSNTKTKRALSPLTGYTPVFQSKLKVMVFSSVESFAPIYEMFQNNLGSSDLRCLYKDPLALRTTSSNCCLRYQGKIANQLKKGEGAVKSLTNKSYQLTKHYYKAFSFKTQRAKQVGGFFYQCFTKKTSSLKFKKLNNTGFRLRPSAQPSDIALTPCCNITRLNSAPWSLTNLLSVKWRSFNNTKRLLIITSNLILSYRRHTTVYCLEGILGGEKYTTDSSATLNNRTLEHDLSYLLKKAIKNCKSLPYSILIIYLNLYSLFSYFVSKVISSKTTNIILFNLFTDFNKQNHVGVNPWFILSNKKSKNKIPSTIQIHTSSIRVNSQLKCEYVLLTNLFLTRFDYSKSFLLKKSVFEYFMFRYSIDIYGYLGWPRLNSTAYYPQSTNSPRLDGATRFKKGLKSQKEVPLFVCSVLSPSAKRSDVAFDDFYVFCGSFNLNLNKELALKKTKNKNKKQYILNTLYFKHYLPHNLALLTTFIQELSVDNTSNVSNIRKILILNNQKKEHLFQLFSKNNVLVTLKSGDSVDRWLPSELSRVFTPLINQQSVLIEPIKTHWTKTLSFIFIEDNLFPLYIFSNTKVPFPQMIQDLEDNERNAAFPLTKKAPYHWYFSAKAQWLQPIQSSTTTVLWQYNKKTQNNNSLVSVFKKYWLTIPIDYFYLKIKKPKVDPISEVNVKKAAIREWNSQLGIVNKGFCFQTKTKKSLFFKNVINKSISQCPSAPRSDIAFVYSNNQKDRRNTLNWTEVWFSRNSRFVEIRKTLTKSVISGHEITPQNVFFFFLIKYHTIRPYKDTFFAWKKAQFCQHSELNKWMVMLRQSAERSDFELSERFTKHNFLCSCLAPQNYEHWKHKKPQLKVKKINHCYVNQGVVEAPPPRKISSPLTSRRNLELHAKFLASGLRPLTFYLLTKPTLPSRSLRRLFTLKRFHFTTQNLESERSALGYSIATLKISLFKDNFLVKDFRKNVVGFWPRIVHMYPCIFIKLFDFKKHMLRQSSISSNVFGGQSILRVSYLGQFSLRNKLQVSCKAKVMSETSPTFKRFKCYCYFNNKEISPLYDSFYCSFTKKRSFITKFKIDKSKITGNFNDYMVLKTNKKFDKKIKTFNNKKKKKTNNNNTKLSIYTYFFMID